MESMRKGIALEYKRTNLKDEGQIKDSDARKRVHLIVSSGITLRVSLIINISVVL